MLKWLFKRTNKNENVAQKMEFDDLNDPVLKVGNSADDMYGVFAIAEKDGKTEDFPFCCLKVTEKKSQNHQILSDYSFWFSNKP
jgi:hypothetical protein